MHLPPPPRLECRQRKQCNMNVPAHTRDAKPSAPFIPQPTPCRGPSSCKPQGVAQSTRTPACPSHRVSP
eukprot:10341633-Alexandrium_andersonii.AAC.1